MKQFDPTAHRELKVYLHTDLPASPSAANFAKLNNPPNNSAVKSLERRDEKMAPDLQLSRAEAQKYSAGQPVFAFWTDLLTKRAQNFRGRRCGGGGALRSHRQSGPAGTGIFRSR